MFSKFRAAGLDGESFTNQLFSLTGEGSNRRWTEEFPPMPTRRYATMALCTRTALIVAGGMNQQCSKLKTIEVMNFETRQWSVAADLPVRTANLCSSSCLW